MTDLPETFRRVDQHRRLRTRLHRELVTGEGQQIPAYMTDPPAVRDPHTFVLVHGLGTSHRYFGRLQAVLAPGAHTISLDLPGFGGTKVPPGPWPLERFAQAVAEILESETDGPVVLIGHSMGAPIVAETARRVPDKVSRVILIGPATDPARATSAHQVRDLLLSAARDSPVGNVQELIDIARSWLRWPIHALEAMLAFHTQDAVADLTTPVLVLRGERDKVARAEWCQQLAASATHGQLVEIAGQRHLVHYTAPIATAAAILRFTSPDTRRSGSTITGK